MSQESECNKPSLLYKPSELRKILMPFKILSLLSTICCASLVFLLYFSKLIKNLKEDIQITLVISAFALLCVTSLVIKLLQAKISYDEIKKNYLTKPIFHLYETLEIDAKDFKKRQKVRYCLAVATSMMFSIIFIVPVFIKSLGEKFSFFDKDDLNILEKFCKYFYAIAFLVTILSTLVILGIQFRMRILNKRWIPLDNSIENKDEIICVFVLIQQIFEHTATKTIEMLFNIRDEINQSENIDETEQLQKKSMSKVFKIMSRNYFISNALFLSSGKNDKNTFGIVSANITYKEKEEKRRRRL